MHTVLEILNLSTEHLKKMGIQHPRRQAEELIGEALEIGRMGVYLNFDRPLTEVELERCRSWLKRRSQGEPLQYIKGVVDFSGCKIKVTPNVLIPRQETEILVEKIIKDLKSCNLEGKELWDVCCGSGYIGIALKKHLPELRVVLSDISPEALEIAKENASTNDVEVEILQGDLLKPFLQRKADFFVCNPPYIAEKEYDTLDVEVRKYEPKLSLISGESGLEFYVKLAEQLPNRLNPGAKVWFEIGTGQGETIKQLFEGHIWRHRAIELDWAGHERFFLLEME